MLSLYYCCCCCSCWCSCSPLLQCRQCYTLPHCVEQDKYFVFRWWNSFLWKNNDCSLNFLGVYITLSSALHYAVPLWTRIFFPFRLAPSVTVCARVSSLFLDRKMLKYQNVMSSTLPISSIVVDILSSSSISCSFVILFISSPLHSAVFLPYQPHFVTWVDQNN